MEAQAVDDDTVFVEGLEEPAPLHVCVARLEPGDVIVVEAADVLSEQAERNAFEQLQSMFPAHRVMVLSEGMRLKIARPTP